jgi:hypothetical protein
MYVPGITKKRGSSVKDRSASMPAGGVGNVASEALLSAASEAKESKKEKKNKSTIAKRKKSAKGCDAGGLSASAEAGKISSQDLRSIFQSGEGAGQFGVALEVLMFNQRLKFPTLRIPLVIKQCIEYLLNSGALLHTSRYLHAPQMRTLYVLPDDLFHTIPATRFSNFRFQLIFSTTRSKIFN